jgi:O-antigen/teichoic acid export membrane protein
MTILPQPARNLLTALTALVSANAFALLGGLLLHICIARVLGVEAAGLYSAASATALLLSAVIDMGFDVSLPRDIAGTPDTKLQVKMITEAQATKNILWLGCMFIMIGGQVWNACHTSDTSDISTAWATIFFALWTLPRAVSLTCMAALRGMMRSVETSRVESIFSLVLYSVSCWLVFLPFSVLSIVLLLITIMSVAEGLKALVFIRKVTSKDSQNVSSANVSSLFSFFFSTWILLCDRTTCHALVHKLYSGQLSLMMLQAASAAEARAGILALQMLNSLSSVGYFAAAMRFITVLRTIPGATLNVLLPIFIAQQTRHSSETFHGDISLRILLFGGLCLSLPVSFALFFFASDIVIAVYSPMFQSAAPVLTILAWAFPLQVITHILEARLLASKRERWVNAGLLVGLVVVAMWNLTFTPLYGPISTAWSVLVGQSVMMMIYGSALFYERGKGFLGNA